MNTGMTRGRFRFRLRGAKNVLTIFVPLLIVTAAIAQVPGGGRGPATLPAGIQTQLNIPYVQNGHRQEVLNLYLPEELPDKPLPLVIWIHGGAWLGGSRVDPPILFLVSKGFAVASIDYRLSQDAIWPEQAYDCKAAVRFCAPTRPNTISTPITSEWAVILPAGIWPPLWAPAAT